MRPQRQQENGFGSFVLNKIEHDPQVVTRAARPGVFQLTLKFVGF
jgi:hypothetical protein